MIEFVSFLAVVICFVVLNISAVTIMDATTDVKSNTQELEYKYDAKIQEKLYSQIVDNENELEEIIKEVIRDNNYELKYLNYKKIDNENTEIVLEDKYRNKVEAIIVTNNLGKALEVKLNIIPSTSVSGELHTTVKVKELRKYKDSEYAKDILEYVIDYIVNGSEAIIKK